MLQVKREKAMGRRDRYSGSIFFNRTFHHGSHKSKGVRDSARLFPAVPSDRMSSNVRS